MSTVNKLRDSMVQNHSMNLLIQMDTLGDSWYLLVVSLSSPTSEPMALMGGTMRETHLSKVTLERYWAFGEEQACVLINLEYSWLKLVDLTLSKEDILWTSILSFKSWYTWVTSELQSTHYCHKLWKKTVISSFARGTEEFSPMLCVRILKVRFLEWMQCKVMISLGVAFHQNSSFAFRW